MAERSRSRSARPKAGRTQVGPPSTVPIALLTARGRLGVILGWVLVVGGALALAVQVATGVGSTLGPHGVTYLTDPALRSAPGWLTAVVLFAPLFGFNLVYWSSPVGRRTRNMATVLVVLIVEMLTLTAATYWYCGADLPPSALFDSTATTTELTVAVHFFLACVLSAAAIMMWLGRNSTFDQQSAQYFGPGRTTTVTTTAISRRTNLVFVAGLFLLLLLTLAPLIPSSHRTGSEGDHAVAPWPIAYSDHTFLVGALAFYPITTAVLWALSSSFLVRKALYAGPWAAKAAASPRRGGASWAARLANRVQHGPFVVGAVVVVASMTLPNPDQIGYRYTDTRLVAGLVALAVGAALGVLCHAQAWKVRDLNRPQLRLRRAGTVYRR